MACLRALAVSIIAFLLLSPLIKTTIRFVEKPVIIVASDNSKSLLFCKDSAYYKNQYPAEINKLIDDLKENYDVRTYSFGEKVSDKISTNFNDKQSDISALFDEVKDVYTNRNVGALILASDGIYNKGNDPLYTSENLSYPIYTIALGDTNVQKDIIISRVNYNKTVFLGNSFPVQLLINAFDCSGEHTKLTVSKGSEVLSTNEININKPVYEQTINLQLDATKPGLQHYHLKVTSVKNEISITNNEADVYIEVIDQRQKILVLYNSPHPDIAAIKETIERNENYSVEVSDADQFVKPLNAYNLVILHQLPSVSNSGQRFTNEIAKFGIPCLYVVGQQTNLNTFNSLRTGLNITGYKTSSNESSPVINNEFALFTVSELLRRSVENLPPLNSPFGNYKTTTSSNVLFYQKIGSVSTSQPLIMFIQYQEQRNGIIAGEGIWKWRIFDYMQNNNHNLFNEMFEKIVQFLCVKLDKSLFRVLYKNQFLENETVEFDAEVFNESYELINDPDVKLTITNAENKSFPYIFSRLNKSYHLDIGNLPVGDYRFSATVKVGDKIYQKSGAFNVMPVNIESLRTVADHQILYSLAKKHGGEMLFPKQMQQIIEKIKKRDDIKSVSYYQKRFNDVVNLFWVFILIIVLLTTEWFIRKRSGSY